MARRRRDTGFWLGEFLRSIFRWFVNWFKAKSPEELVERAEEKAFDASRGAYETGVRVLSGRKQLEVQMTEEKAKLDALHAKMVQAVNRGDDIMARAIDQEIQLLKPVIVQLEAQLVRTLTRKQTRAAVSLRIAKARLQVAQARGYATQIYTNEMLREIASWQEELAGLGGRVDDWEIEELAKRARAGTQEVEARLELSADLLKTQVATEAEITLGEPSEELIALMQQRDAGELKVEEDTAGLDESLLDFVTTEE